MKKNDIYIKVSGIAREPKEKEIITFYQGKKAKDMFKRTMPKNRFYDENILKDRGYYSVEAQFTHLDDNYIMIFYITNVKRFYEFRPDISPVLKQFLRNRNLDKLL